MDTMRRTTEHIDSRQHEITSIYHVTSTSIAEPPTICHQKHEIYQSRLHRNFYNVHVAIYSKLRN